MPVSFVISQLSKQLKTFRELSAILFRLHTLAQLFMSFPLRSWIIQRYQGIRCADYISYSFSDIFNKFPIICVFVVKHRANFLSQIFQALLHMCDARYAGFAKPLYSLIQLAVVIAQTGCDFIATFLHWSQNRDPAVSSFWLVYDSAPFLHRRHQKQKIISLLFHWTLHLLQSSHGLL